MPLNVEPLALPIAEALLELGGAATSGEILTVLLRNTKKTNWNAQVLSQALQHHAPECPQSKSRNKDLLFHHAHRDFWKIWCHGLLSPVPYGLPDKSGSITSSQYAACPEYPPHELIDGYLYRVVNSGLEQTRTSAALHNHFEGIAHSVNGLAVPCRGRRFKVKVGERSVVEPDLLYIRDKKAFHFTNGCIFECGVPNVMFEVLAPGDARRDRLLKLHEYAKLGIPEYWIVDPVAGVIDFLVLRKGSYFVQVPKAWCYQSPVSPEVRIDLREFWSPLVPHASGEVRVPVSAA